MLHTLVRFVSLVKRRERRGDDYEYLLYIMTIALFTVLFVRTLIALYMGRWNLFID